MRTEHELVRTFFSCQLGWEHPLTAVRLFIGRGIPTQFLLQCVFCVFCVFVWLCGCLCLCVALMVGSYSRQDGGKFVHGCFAECPVSFFA